MRMIKVKGYGLGSGFNVYHKSFDLEVGIDCSADDIWRLAVRRMKQLTACESVRIEKIWEETMILG